MCGRFVGYSTLDQIRSHFKVETVLSEQVQPSYNIAPQQQVAVVAQEGSDRILSFLNWGLVPFWAKDPSIGNRMINARSETVAEKPACTILTTEASESIKSIHHRMPIILKPSVYGRWLDPIRKDPIELNQIFAGYSYRNFESHPVSKDVNSALNNDQSLIIGI